MANRFQIRSGSSTPSPSDLLDKELGYNVNDKKLYINNNGSIEEITTGRLLEIAGGVATEAWYEFADLVITRQFGSGAGTFTLQSSGLRRFTAIIFVRLYQQSEMSATGLVPQYTTLHVTGMTGITSDDIRGILVTDTTAEKRMRFFVRLPSYARGTIFASGLEGDITPKAERVDALPSGIELAASVIDTYIDGKKVWHEGNDGEGSGLDADTIAGWPYFNFPMLRGKRSTIPEGADLNTYISPGTFVCYTSAAAGTIINVPVGSAFKLTVNWVLDNKDYIVQRFEAFNNEIYYRRSSNGGATWDAWKRIWHSGNDGVGSGLDADTVDGHHWSEHPTKGNIVATLWDDEVLVITPPTQFGIIIIFPRHPSYGNVWGGFIYRHTTNVFVRQMFGDPVMATTVGVLTGTTGQDNRVTVSACSGGKLYIENRRGLPISINYILMGS